jgi:quercetin dioxygenase-like cupin family protein
MITLDPVAAARAAVASHRDRPATALLLDTPDVRLLVFRLGPGQVVPPHRSTSTVTLTVLEGSGTLSGGDEERLCHTGDVVSYAPEELHGMRADAERELLLLATIAPRPGARTVQARASVPHESMTREG